MSISIRHQNSTSQPQQLLGVQTKVSPDGAEAEVTLHTTTGKVDFTVTFDGMASAHAEIRNASLLMLYRQSMKSDGGAQAISGMLATALRPVQTDVIVDAKTADRIFIMHFADRMPIVIRQTSQQVIEAQDDMASEARRVAH